MQGLASQSSVPELKRKQDCGQTTKYIEEGGEASFGDELSQASYLHMQRNIISLSVNVKVYNSLPNYREPVILTDLDPV